MTSPATQLIALAQKEFQQELTNSETRFLAQSVTSEVTRFGPKNDDNNSPLSNPLSSGTWSPDRQIGARLIRWLCVDQKAKTLLDVKGIQLEGARITGVLDLSYANIPFRMSFRRCGFSETFRMHASETKELVLTGSSLVHLDFQRTHIRGAVWLDEGFHVTQGVDLKNSQIDGDLDCGGGFFQGPMDDDGISEAIIATDAVVLGNVYFGDNSECRGAVKFANIRIGADLDCSGNRDVAGGKTIFRSSRSICHKGENIAFNAASATVRLDFLFGSGLTAHGAVDIQSLACGGDLTFTGGATLNGTPDYDDSDTGFALRAGNIQIAGLVTMDDKTQCNGAIGFDGSHLKNNLDLSGARLFNPKGSSLAASGTALFLNNSQVDGDLNLNGCRVNGAITASNSHIGGEMTCRNAAFDNRASPHAPAGGLTLIMLRSTIAGSVSMTGKFEALGGMQLSGTHIGGDLNMEGAKLHCTGELKDDEAYAFRAETLSCTGNILLRNDFQGYGLVAFMDASCSGNFDGSDALFSNPFQKDTPGTGIALDASRISVGLILFLRGRFESRGQIRFSDARVGPLFDCTGGTFSRSINELLPEDLCALDCHRLQSAGDVFLSGRFSAHGSVNFDNADIAGGLFAENSSITNPIVREFPTSGVALSGFSLKVGRGISIRNKFHAEGKVTFINAKVEQSVDFTGATFSNTARPDSVALTLSGTSVKGSIFMEMTFS